MRVEPRQVETRHPAIRANFDLSIRPGTPVPVAPELRALVRQIGWFTLNTWTYRIFRWLMACAPPSYDKTGVTVTEVPEIGRGALVVAPEKMTGKGALFLIHGGGFVMGRNKDLLAAAAKLARSAGVPIICPTYRLAPQAPAPAAIDDVHEAWQDVQSRATALGIAAEKIVLGGVSAGGGLAASLAQRLYDQDGTQPAAQLLIYPMLDDRTAAQHELDTPRHRVWSNRNNRFGWTSYLAQPPGHPVPSYWVAARRDDLSGLPPTWLGVGTCDLFLHENRDYVERLRKAQVDVTYFEIDGAIHGFDMANTELSKAFGHLQSEFVKKFTE